MSVSVAQQLDALFKRVAELRTRDARLRRRGAWLEQERRDLAAEIEEVDELIREIEGRQA